MTQYANAQKKSIKDVRKRFAFSVFKSIVMTTPVDTGRARGNWQISVGKDTEEQLDRESKNGENIKDESEKLNSVNGDEPIFICNNLPYITVLEYGGYPDPVKKGSYDKKTKSWVIKSSGGFSKQAPQGMVGKVLADRQRLIDKAVKGIEE